MKNITELRSELSTVFDKLKAGDIKEADAAVLANIAGKMINSAKVQVEYNLMRKTSPKINFLEEAA